MPHPAASAKSAKMAIDVIAGLVPGQDPDPQFTRRFVLTSEQWHEREGLSDQQAGFKQAALLAQLNGQAAGYAQLLMAMPARLNWVRMDWVWF